jgi:hypothetical protein
MWASLKATDRKVFRNRISTVVLLFLIFSAVSSGVQAQNTGTFIPSDKFQIPQQNGSISFNTNGSYSSATLQNNTWYFTGLSLNNSSSLGNLTVSVKNSNITIYSYYSSQSFSQFRRTAMVRYYIEGQGEQVFNLGLNVTGPTLSSAWSVIVPAYADGTGSAFLAEGDGWHLRSDNTVVIDGLTGNVTIAYFGFNQSPDSNLPFVEQHSVALATIVIVAVTIAVAALISYRVRRNR